MDQVFAWADAEAASTYAAIRKQLNTVHFLSTSGARPWDASLRYYRRRTDARAPSAYDAIAAMEGPSPGPGLLEDILMEPAGASPHLVLYSDEGAEPGVVWAFHAPHSLRLDATSLAAAEHILVPRKDGDHRLRQALRLSGFDLGGVLRVGTICAGNGAALGLLVHVRGDSPARSSLAGLLPAGAVPAACAAVPRDYIAAIQRLDIV